MRKFLFSMFALVTIALGAKAEPTYTAVGTVTNDSTWDAAGYISGSAAAAPTSSRQSVTRATPTSLYVIMLLAPFPILMTI